MDSLSVGAVINAGVIAGYAIVAGWLGYQRRRAFWSRGSWIGLGATLFISFGLLGFSLAFSAAVDAHAPWVGAAHSGTRAAWVVVALGCMIGGSALGAGSLAWFARGNPSQPFPIFGSVGSAAAATSALEQQGHRYL